MSLWDRLVLLVAWVLTCGLVYVLGIYVGKGTHESRLGIAERVVRLPVASTPPPEGQRPKGESELRFYETLMSDKEPDARAEAKALPPAPKPAAVSQGTNAKPTTAVPATATPPAPTPAARPASTPPPVDAPPRTARPETTAPSRTPVDATATPRPSATAPSPAAEARPPGLARTGGWTVQANPTRSREEAEGLLRQLHGRGYEASIVRVLRDGDTWYRVQVGHFATSQQATEVMQKLREREGVSHAFVASE
jgi:cell division septation protein DedD